MNKIQLKSKLKKESFIASLWNSSKLLITKPRAVFVFLVFFALLIGCSGSNVIPREGSITGRIIDKSKKPVEAATVTWSYDSSRFTYTNENGYFMIEGIAFGEQTFDVEANSYKTLSFVANILSGELTTIQPKTMEKKSFDFYIIEEEEISATHALIHWETDENTNGIIEYGKTQKLGQVVKQPENHFARNHKLEITNLEPETRYYYRISASRRDYSAEYSAIKYFTTLSSVEDLKAPQPPRNIAAALTEQPNQVTVFWAANQEPDLRGYKVYRSDLANDRFEQIGTLIIPKGRERYTDSSVSAGNKYFYKVSAIDQAGNESGFESIAEILVPGEISTSVRWRRANSPYHLMGDITITETGRLDIESGVKVLIADYDSYRKNDPNKIDFIVSGVLVASAGYQMPVTFASNETNPPNNSWNGLYFKNALGISNSLVNVVISDSSTGLKIENSRGSFSEITTLNCPIAFKISKTSDFSIDKLIAMYPETGLEISSNKSLTVKDSTIFHAQNAVISQSNNGLLLSGCNFLEYVKSAITTNESTSNSTFENNLFVSPVGTAIQILAKDPLIKNNTFDSPYGIIITSGEPNITKNIFLIIKSAFQAGVKAIAHEGNLTPLPIFGPNNITGYESEKMYIGCKASNDSSSDKVVPFLKLTAEEYDYRLSNPYPNSSDPWGIIRTSIPFKE